MPLGFLAILRWSDIPMTISSQHDPRTWVAGEGEPGSPFSFSWRKGNAVLTESWIQEEEEQVKGFGVREERQTWT